MMILGPNYDHEGPYKGETKRHALDQEDPLETGMATHSSILA